MAVAPWDISASRIGWEPAAMLPFLLFGLLLLHRGLERETARAVIGGAALLAIGAYSYRAESFYAATLTIALLAIEWKRTVRMAQELWIALAVALLILGPIALSVLAQPHMLTSGPAQGTFDNGVNELSLAEFRHLYLGHFSPAALFLNGDGNMQHGPPIGVLPPWTFPFILIGLAAPPSLFPLRARLFAIAWILLYPFGGSLTDEGGGQHFIRTMAGAPLASLLTAVGLLFAWSGMQALVRRFPRASALPAMSATIVAALAIAEFSHFWHAYFVAYPGQAAHIFHYGDREIFRFVRAHAAGSERICFTSLDGWNYEAQTKFYLPDAPMELNGWMAPDCTKPHTLLSLKAQSEAPPKAQFLGTVQNWSGTVRSWFYSIP
jgi:uncharacterized membrane protein YphA (DoxX/SURF4 family)